MPRLIFAYAGVPPLSPALKAYLESHTNPMAHTVGIAGAAAICCLTLALVPLAYIKWRSAPIVKQPRYGRIPTLVRTQYRVWFTYILLIAAVAYIYYRISRSTLVPAFILLGAFTFYYAITVILILRQQSFDGGKRGKLRFQTGKRGVVLSFLSYLFIALFTVAYLLVDLAYMFN